MAQTNERGLSLVEVMVATAITCIIAYSSFTMFPFVRKMSVRSRAVGSCKAYLNQNFNRLQQLGARHTLGVSTSAAPPSFLSSVLPQIAGAGGMSPAQMSPGANQPLVTFVDSNTSTKIETAGLFMADSTLMSALYRNNASICSTGVSFTGSQLTASSLLLPPPQEISDGLMANLVIKPLDLTTLQVKNCTDPNFDQSSSAIVAPKGLAQTTSQAQQLSIATLADTVRNNMGFAVTLSIDYNSNGTAMSCTETRNMMFTAHLNPPISPTLSFTQSSSYNDTAYGPTTSDLTIGYGYPGGNLDPGVVLMCRDRSTMAPLTAPPAAHPTKDVTVYWTGIPPNNGQWVPCEVVSACGVSKKNSSYFGNTGASYAITNHYSNTHTLPYGCTVIIDAVSVDAFGNVSSTTNVNHYVSDP